MHIKMYCTGYYIKTLPVLGKVQVYTVTPYILFEFKFLDFEISNFSQNVPT